MNCNLLILLFYFAVVQKDSNCLPFERNEIDSVSSSSSSSSSISTLSSNGFVPMKSFYFRTKKAQIVPNGGGIGDFFSTAVQDGVSSTSAFTSPTMFLGGFSIMMQPLPNGTEFAGQLTQAFPHYLNFIPGLPQLMGTVRRENLTET